MKITSMRSKSALTGFIMMLVGALSMVVPANAQGKFAKYGEFASTQEVNVDHAPWDAFLSKYIKTTDDNRTIVKYGDVSSTDKKALKSYLESLEAIDTRTLTKAQAYAYWVNFYNALTVDLILDNYPLKSIRQIGFRGPWGRKLLKVNGTDLTLNNVEHDILRVFWSDPRTHYAVNCASFGCPNLQAVAFTVANTDELLTKGAVEFVNHPRGIDVDARGNVNASSIYNWYKVDFGNNAEGILKHVRQYANDEVKAKLEGKTRIASYDYDWALNEK